MSSPPPSPTLFAFSAEQSAVERLNELDRLKTDFVGTVSHELRTPLTAIVGFGELLAESIDDLDQATTLDYLKRITRNAASLSAVVQQVLDFSRLERDTLRVVAAPGDLAVLVRQTLEGLAPLIGDHPITANVPDSLVAITDRDAVERILSNLLTNAVKFSPPRAGIEVTLAVEGSMARLAVEDHGQGVADGDETRIFERFYRGQSDAAMSTRGAGIGLAVVNELVHQLNGTIALERPDHPGSRFVVRLPLPAPRSDDTDAGWPAHALTGGTQ